MPSYSEDLAVDFLRKAFQSNMDLILFGLLALQSPLLWAEAPEEGTWKSYADANITEVVPFFSRIKSPCPGAAKCEFSKSLTQSASESSVFSGFDSAKGECDKLLATEDKRTLNQDPKKLAADLASTKSLEHVGQSMSSVINSCQRNTPDDLQSNQLLTNYYDLGRLHLAERANQEELAATNFLLDEPAPKNCNTSMFKDVVKRCAELAQGCGSANDKNHMRLKAFTKQAKKQRDIITELDKQITEANSKIQNLRSLVAKLSEPTKHSDARKELDTKLKEYEQLVQAEGNLRARNPWLDDSIFTEDIKFGKDFQFALGKYFRRKKEALEIEHRDTRHAIGCLTGGTNSENCKAPEFNKILGRSPQLSEPDLSKTPATNNSVPPSPSDQTSSSSLNPRLANKLYRYQSCILYYQTKQEQRKELTKEVAISTGLLVATLPLGSMVGMAGLGARALVAARIGRAVETTANIYSAKIGIDSAIKSCHGHHESNLESRGKATTVNDFTCETMTTYAVSALSQQEDDCVMKTAFAGLGILGAVGGIAAKALESPLIGPEYDLVKNVAKNGKPIKGAVGYSDYEKTVRKISSLGPEEKKIVLHKLFPEWGTGPEFEAKAQQILNAHKMDGTLFQLTDEQIKARAKEMSLLSKAEKKKVMDLGFAGEAKYYDTGHDINQSSKILHKYTDEIGKHIWDDPTGEKRAAYGKFLSKNQLESTDFFRQFAAADDKLKNALDWQIGKVSKVLQNAKPEDRPFLLRHLMELSEDIDRAANSTSIGREATEAGRAYLRAQSDAINIEIIKLIPQAGVKNKEELMKAFDTLERMEANNSLSDPIRKAAGTAAIDLENTPVYEQHIKDLNHAKSVREQAADAHELAKQIPKENLDLHYKTIAVTNYKSGDILAKDPIKKSDVERIEKNLNEVNDRIKYQQSHRYPISEKDLALQRELQKSADNAVYQYSLVQQRETSLAQKYTQNLERRQDLSKSNASLAPMPTINIDSYTGTLKTIKAQQTFLYDSEYKQLSEIRKQIADLERNLRNPQITHNEALFLTHKENDLKQLLKTTLEQHEFRYRASADTLAQKQGRIYALPKDSQGRVISTSTGAQDTNKAFQDILFRSGLPSSSDDATLFKFYPVLTKDEKETLDAGLKVLSHNSGTSLSGIAKDVSLMSTRAPGADTHTLEDSAKILKGILDDPAKREQLARIFESRELTDGTGKVLTIRNPSAVYDKLRDVLNLYLARDPKPLLEGL